MCNLDKTYVDVKPRKGYKLAKSQFGKYEEIPKDWEIEKLVDIGKIMGGGTPNSKNEEYWNGDVLWAVPTDITKLQTNYINDTERKITKEGLDSSSAKLLPIGTILLTSRATLGKCTITKKPISTNQGFQNIVCYDKFYNVFVFYQMRFNRNTVIRLSYGTTFLEISKKEIGKILIPVPVSIKEQQKIASILSGVDANIEATQKVIDKTEKLKKGLMQQLLTKGIGHTKFKTLALNPKFVKIRIPKNTNSVQLEQVVELIRGTSYISSEINSDGIGDIFINLSCFQKSGGFINNGILYFTGHTNKKPIQVGDVLISVTDITRDGNVIGFPLTIPSFHNKKIFHSMDAAHCKIKNKTLKCEYLFYLFSSKFFHKSIFSFSAGTTVLHLNLTSVKKILIPIPSISEQIKIASILSGVDAIGIALLFTLQVYLRMKVARMLVLCCSSIVLNSYEKFNFSHHSNFHTNLTG